MEDNNQSAAAAQGKQILLGKVHAEIEFPNGKKLKIKRMPMAAELRFIEQYQGMVERIKECKLEIFGKLREFMNGASAVNFGLIEGLEMISALFGQLPAFQEGLVGAVMIIVEAQNSDITKADIQDKQTGLSSADCLEILASQAEVQGLLGSFRSIIAGLRASGPVQG